jgi:hypothetical protein
MVDGLVLSSNNPILLNYHRSKSIHLGDVSGSFPVETSRSINQMVVVIRNDLDVRSLASKVFLVVSHRAGLWMVHIIRPCFDPHLEAAGGAVSYSISLGSYRGRNCQLGTSTVEAWGNHGGIHPTL